MVKLLSSGVMIAVFPLSGEREYYAVILGHVCGEGGFPRLTGIQIGIFRKYYVKERTEWAVRFLENR